MAHSEWKTGLVFFLWVVILGPVAQILLWAGVEGFPLSSQKLALRYVVIAIHFVCYTPVFYAGLMLLRSRRIRLHWIVTGAGFVILAVLCSLCAISISVALGFKSGENWTKSMVVSVAEGIAVTAIILMIERLYHSAMTSRLDAQQRELDRERALRTAMEAQWISLESRVQPHFLFNTLSSIRELMHRNVPEAEVMIHRFANLIRFSLDSGHNPLVALEDEIGTVSGYLEIEQMRFGSRLKWSMSIPHDCRQVRVPSLGVLTPVENSVKHVVACRRAGGMVAVAASLDGPLLRIQISDDGPGFDESAIVHGHGLDLLLRRLENLFQGEATLTIGPVTDGLFTLALSIPAFPIPAQFTDRGADVTAGRSAE